MKKFLFLILTITLAVGIVFFLSTFHQPEQNKVVSYAVIGECSNNGTENLQQLIVWQKDRLVKWSDFKGIPETSTSEAACTRTFISYHYYYHLVANVSKPSFEITDVKVTASFRPLDSWVDSNVLELNQTIQNKLLKHEQGHFDLAEVYAQKIQENMTSVIGKIIPIEIQDTTNDLTNANHTAKFMFDKIYNQSAIDWHKSELQYDKETNHSRIESAQEKYNEFFDRLRS